MNNFMRFCCVGAFCASLDLLQLFIFVDRFGVDLRIALTASFLTTSVVSFNLNKLFSFPGLSEVEYQYVRFLCISAIGLFLTMVLMIILTHVGIHYLVAKILTLAIVVAWNFGANKQWTFR